MSRWDAPGCPMEERPLLTRIERLPTYRLVYEAIERQIL